MRRREFIGLAGAAAAWPFAARAGETGRTARVGCLAPESAGQISKLWDAFRQGLSSLGYVEGKNVQLEFRYADQRIDRMQAATTDLVRLNVDVIVTHSVGVTFAHNASATIPIVMAVGPDVVATGLVDSLAHPGGNVTGSTFFLPELLVKRLELVKQAAPATTRIGFLSRRDAPEPALVKMEEAAKAFGVELAPVEVSGASEFESVFSTWAGQQVGAVAIEEIFFTDLPQLAALAVKYHMASVGPVEWAASGGLIGYGVDFSVLFRRAAYFVDKILKGARPGEIPIEQASKFTAVVNLKTAKALGLEIPPDLLAAADEVIE